MSRYLPPMIDSPAREEVKSIAEELNLKIPEDHIQYYHGVIDGVLSKEYQVFAKYAEPALPVKYPRTPGYRPSQEENKYNAWSQKTDIKGAPTGPLKGYTVAIKDNIPVAGVPMMLGSRVMEGYVPDCDSTAVTRLLDAGATIAGKATCEDMCFYGSSFSAHPRPVLNPHNEARSAGGTCSGCAVVVQTGEADLALGADQAGSIRIPCCWNGIVGMKPTYGLIPYTGVGSMTPAVDHLGPIAKNVKGCALMLEVLAGDDDDLDMRQRNIPSQSNIPKYSELLTDNIEGKRIGIVKEGFTDCQLEVDKIIRESVNKLKERGAKVEEMSIPIHEDSHSLFMPTFLEGCYHNMYGSHGLSTGPPSYQPTRVAANYRAFTTANKRQFPETTKLTLILCKYIQDNYGMNFYGKSQNMMLVAKEKYNDALKDYDVIVMPTIKHLVSELPTADTTPADRIRVGLNMLANTAVFNGTGHPALTINAGYVDGLPVGMMIIGKHLDEQTVFNVAYAYETIRDAAK